MKSENVIIVDDANNPWSIFLVRKDHIIVKCTVIADTATIPKRLRYLWCWMSSMFFFLLFCIVYPN
jgi:hypothetical protein